METKDLIRLLIAAVLMFLSGFITGVIVCLLFRPAKVSFDPRPLPEGFRIVVPAPEEETELEGLKESDLFTITYDRSKIGL